VFSELNNLNILTFDPEYEGICGITEDELMTQLKPDIEWLSEAISQYKPMTYDETVAELKRMYDGYHFSRQMTDVYNPWSLFYAFEKGWIDNYWFSTGTPSSLINLLRTGRMDMARLEHLEADMTQFDAHDPRPLYAVRLNVNTGKRTIDSYTVEQMRH